MSIMMHAEWENNNDAAIDEIWEETLKTALMALVRFAENSGHMALQSKPYWKEQVSLVSLSVFS
jgi:predicted NAD/FAD-binding protein